MAEAQPQELTAEQMAQQLLASPFAPPSLPGQVEELSEVVGGYLGESRTAGLPPWLASTIREGDARWPGYPEGYGLPLLSSLPTEALLDLQDQMLLIGLTSSVVPGQVDGNTIAAFDRLLAMANARRSRWQMVLRESVRLTQERGEPADPGPVDVYRPPSYATVAQEVRRTMRDMIRRDPTDAEMALLGDELMRLHRQEFDASVEAADLQAEGMETGAGRVIEGPAATDPLAEFQERMRERYAGEVEAVEDVDERQRATATAGMVANSLGSLVAGGA